MLSVPEILSPDFHTNLAKIHALLNRGVYAVVRKKPRHTSCTPVVTLDVQRSSLLLGGIVVACGHVVGVLDASGHAR